MRRYSDRLELSAEENVIIRKRYQEARDRRIAERLLCLLMKEEGLTHGMISRVLGVSEGTISHWISLYHGLAFIKREAWKLCANFLIGVILAS